MNIKIAGSFANANDYTHIQNLLNGVPTVPTYKSASKGEIPIASMNPQHRVNAMRKIVGQVLDEVKASLLTYTTSSELEELAAGLPMNKTTRELLRNLAGVKPTPTEQTTPTPTSTPKTLDEIWSQIMKKIQ